MQALVGPRSPLEATAKLLMLTVAPLAAFQDLFVLNDEAATRMMGGTLEFTALKILQNSTWILERAGPLFGIALM